MLASASFAAPAPLAGSDGVYGYHEMRIYISIPAPLAGSDSDFMQESMYIHA